MTATEHRKHCPHCPETFHDSSGMQRHIRRKHADVAATAFRAAIEAETEDFDVEHLRVSLGVPEPVRAEDLRVGDTVLWLGEKRTVVSIRRLSAPAPLCLQFTDSLRAYVPRRTIVRRMPS